MSYQISEKVYLARTPIDSRHIYEQGANMAADAYFTANLE